MCHSTLRAKDIEAYDSAWTGYASGLGQAELAIQTNPYLISAQYYRLEHANAQNTWQNFKFSLCSTEDLPHYHRCGTCNDAFPGMISYQIPYSLTGTSSDLAT